MINLENLEKYYNQKKPNEIHVLDDISYEFPERGMCAIFGPSGCGKTTLLNVIGGLDNPTTGAVSYDGRKMTEDADRIRNSEIGFVFQNYNLNKEETVFENVADSLRLCGIDDDSVIEERVMAALSNVGMAKFRKRLPDTLSGGQQQRVAIARAIVKNPKVILADEPTGNLDEANTILVMDILKTMAREHLVILVTHEAKLVDFYCDTVVDLSDGRITGVRTNENTQGYVGRRPNDIYLGELTRSECSNDDVKAEFYGDSMEEPVSVTIVHKNGRVFLRINSAKVTVLDESSEVKLRDGVFEETAAKTEAETRIDMSKLPPAEGKEYGRLFRLRDSIKQGFRANFRNTSGKKKRNALIVCLFFFGIALVFFTALFGQKLRVIRELKTDMNDRVFMVYGGETDLAERIAKAKADPAAAIDYVDILVTNEGRNRLTNSLFYTHYATFETFGFADTGYDTPSPSASFNTEYLPVTILGNCELVAGKKDLQKDDEVLITTQVADRLIKTSPYRFIRGYSELVGARLVPTTEFMDPLRIVGVVSSTENAVYRTESAMNGYFTAYDNVIPDRDGFFGLARGECVMILNETRIGEESLEYVVGDELMYNGLPLKIKSINDVSLTNSSSRMRAAVEEADPEELVAQRELARRILEHFPDLTYNTGRSPSYNPNKLYIWKNSRYFVMNAEDYDERCHTIGQTSLWIMSTKPDTKGQTAIYAGAVDQTRGSLQSVPYYRIHSTDSKTTLAYIAANFADVSYRYGEFGEVSSGVITPNDRFEEAFADHRLEVYEQLAVLAVFFIFFGLCMAMVMRSSVMNRTREIGIYRAIGAKKSNIVFRFMVETVVVLSLSAVIGFLIISVVIGYMSNRSAFADSSSFYYPLWMAIALFVFMMITGVVCGILPVIKLLRKTPAEILAKYDI